MYKLQNNIKIVSGAKNHCIYDLNARKLYSLDSEHLGYLNEMISGNAAKVPVDVSDYFIKAGIVIPIDREPIGKIDPYVYDKNISFAWIEITQNCNLYCRHCYEGSSKNKTSEEMTMEDFHTAIDALVSIGVKRVQLVGGEPLVHTHIADMIAIAADNFDFIEVYTNGTLLSDELLELITEKKIALAFSLYSEDCSVHDAVTMIKGSHELTSNSISKALALGNTVRVASVEMKGVPRYIYKDERVTARSDLPRITGRAGLHLYTRDMLLRKLIKKDTFRKPINVSEFLQNQTVHNCFGHRLYIACGLDVYPCVMERRLTYGNLKNKPISEMVGVSHAFLTKDKVEVCKDCEFRYACFDCRPDSNGRDIYTKPWYCTYDPYEGIWKNAEDFVDSLLRNS